MSTGQVAPLAALAGLALLAGGAGAGELAVTPLQAVVQEVGGKQVVAYYLRDGDACALTMMIDDSPTAREVRGLPMTSAARLRLNLSTGESALLESVEGADIRLTCADAGASMLVEHYPAGIGIAQR